MNSTAKTLIPNKEWLIKDSGKKIGSIIKSKKGYSLLCNGQSMPLSDINSVKAQFGSALFEESFKKVKPQETETKNYSIYDFPCNTKPHNPIYSVKEKLPLYSKSDKSKSRYCAGYYIVKFRKGWVKCCCPKLITLERYAYHGPFKTEEEMKDTLTKINKS
jgi:hypothetical protein